jgi:hypothetical protein
MTLLPGERRYPGLNEVYVAVNKYWEWKEGVPIVRGEIECPVCTGYGIYREWRYHKRPEREHRSIYRCDVHLKCTYCSHVWVHGVVIPPEHLNMELMAKNRIDRAFALKRIKE